MNLTSQQMDLLFAIVEGHLSGKGATFIFVMSRSGRALIYEDGREVRVDGGDMDLRRLESEGLIALEKLPGPMIGFSGQALPLGIEKVTSMRNKRLMESSPRPRSGTVHETDQQSARPETEKFEDRSPDRAEMSATSPPTEGGYERAIQELSRGDAEERDCDIDFTSERKRNSSVKAYTEHWKCPEAGLARTARVDPADLSKWKKGSLPLGSDKKNRIESVLTKNDAPTPPAKRQTDS